MITEETYTLDESINHKELDALGYIIRVIEERLTLLDGEKTDNSYDEVIKKQHIQWCQIGLYMLYKAVPESWLLNMIEEEESK